MISLFIDLSRAFDTISHKVLFNKLYQYGIRGLALDWIKNYLQNRKQFVIYNNAQSSFGNISMGVPQGSILGPLLFILYVNDLPNVSSKLSFTQFADDTSIFITGKNLKDMSNLMTDQMKRVTDWLKINMLTLNVSKTNYMIMCSRGKMIADTECKIEIDGKIIERVAQCKFLGLIVDDKLTWKCHIDYICGKVSKLIGILIRARKILPICSLITLYNALLSPYFTYCITIWGNTYKTHLKRIEILQKKIIRIITFSQHDAHTRPLFKKVGIMTFKDLYTYFSSMYIYKCINNLTPPSYYHGYKLSHSARNPRNLQALYCSKKICKTSLLFSGHSMWNNLPDNIKYAKSLSSFKSKLKICIINGQA